MADWKVSKEIVEVKEHPNADKLDVLKVGEYQIVAKKGHYKSGDTVIIIPEKSIIPKNSPLYDEYGKYLTGPNQDRVKGIRLRGEYSEAITWPVDDIDDIVMVDNPSNVPGVLQSTIEIAKDAGIGEDISRFLGITKYEAPIPVNMTGQVRQFDGYARNHDVYHYASYKDELQGNVIITEKIHGSQLNYFLDADGSEKVSSKGLLKKGLKIQEDENNVYWQAVRNCNMYGIAHDLLEIFDAERIQIIGEVIPVQKGFSYGATKPEVLVFDVIADGHSVAYSQLPQAILNLWVPIMYIGEVGNLDLDKMCKGNEQVSGKDLHIKEGIVVKDINDRKAHDGKRLILKVINPAYSNTGEEFN